jgi:hypothetical protein
MFRALLAHLQEALHKQLHKDSNGTPILVAANWHNTQAIYEVSFVQRLLKMNKQFSKHVEALIS